LTPLDFVNIAAELTLSGFQMK